MSDVRRAAIGCALTALAAAGCGPPAAYPGAAPPPRDALALVELIPDPEDVRTSTHGEALHADGGLTLLIARRRWDEGFGTIPTCAIVRFDPGGHAIAERPQHCARSTARIAAGTEGSTVLVESCESPDTDGARVVQIVPPPEREMGHACTRLVRLDAALVPREHLRLEGLDATDLAVAPDGSIAVAGRPPQSTLGYVERLVVARLSPAGDALARVEITSAEPVPPGGAYNVALEALQPAARGALLVVLRVSGSRSTRIADQVVVPPRSQTARLIAVVRPDGTVAGARALGSPDIEPDILRPSRAALLSGGEVLLSMHWQELHPQTAAADVGVGRFPLHDRSLYLLGRVGAGAGLPLSVRPDPSFSLGTRVASLVALPNDDVVALVVDRIYEQRPTELWARCDGKRPCSWRDGPRAYGFHEALAVRRVRPGTGTVEARAEIEGEAIISHTALAWLPAERSVRLFLEATGSVTLQGRTFTSPERTFDPCPDGGPRSPRRGEGLSPRAVAPFLATAPLPDPCTRIRHVSPRRFLVRVDLR